MVVWRRAAATNTAADRRLSEAANSIFNIRSSACEDMSRP